MIRIEVPGEPKAMSAPAWNRRVSDEALVDAYQQTGNVHKAGTLVGIDGSSAHERLKRMGLTKPIRVFTEQENERLRAMYSTHREEGKIGDLAEQMGRSRNSIHVQAHRLGIATYKHRRRHLSKWKYMTEDEARRWFERIKKVKRGSVDAWCKKQGIDDLGFSRTMQRFFPAEWEALVELRQPKQSMYRLGRSFEYRVRDELRELGYFVLRSPRSGSPLDLIAIRRGAVLFVQCKLNAKLDVNGWNDLFDLAVSVEDG